jgi:hypothetical protein
MDKLRFIEFDVTPGHILYIPPYWYYSFQYVEHNTIVTGFTYSTIMNSIANLPDIIQYYLQQSNIEKKGGDKLMNIENKIIKEKEILKETEMTKHNEEIVLEKPNESTEIQDTIEIQM